jgi:hypothetical protein
VGYNDGSIIYGFLSGLWPSQRYIRQAVKARKTRGKKQYGHKAKDLNITKSLYMIHQSIMSIITGEGSP